MKKPGPFFFILIVLLSQSYHGFSEELPLFGKLPEPGKLWSLHKQGAAEKPGYSYSWIVFTNSETGDTLSFVADKYDKAVRSVTSSPTRQAAIDMFPGGFPMFMRDSAPEYGAGWLISDTVRSSVIQLSVFNSATKRNVPQDALEYTCIYEDESKKAPNRLAHGYVLAFGELVVFVQHTSTHAITSELANGMAQSLVLIHASQK